MTIRNILLNSLVTLSCIITTQNFLVAKVESYNQDKLSRSEYTILKCSTQNCAPCKHMVPIYQSLSNELNDIVFMSVDVTGNSNLISKFKIRSAPTFIMFKNGLEIGRFTGSRTKTQLETGVKRIKDNASKIAVPAKKPVAKNTSKK